MRCRAQALWREAWLVAVVSAAAAVCGAVEPAAGPRLFVTNVYANGASYVGERRGSAGPHLDASLAAELLRGNLAASVRARLLAVLRSSGPATV